MKSSKIILAWASFISCVFWNTNASADWVYTKVADQSTEIPGEVNSVNFFGAVGYDGQNVMLAAFGAFNGIVSASPAGENMQALVDIHTDIPGLAPLTFDSISFGGETSFDQGKTIFQNKSGNITGIYVASIDNDPIRMIADSNTVIAAGSPDTFINPLNPTINGATVAFNEGTSAIYRTDLNADIYEKIVDLTDTIPGSAAVLFDAVRRPAIVNDLVAFIGEGQNLSGVYLHDTQLSTLVDTSSTLPNSIEVFTKFERIVSFANESVSFIAEGDLGTKGIFNYDLNTQTITPVVTNQEFIPGGGTTFSRIGRGAGSLATALAVDESQHLFAALDSSRPIDESAGLYFVKDNNVVSVINESQLLNGEVFSNPTIISGSLDDGDFVFSVTQNFFPAIYFAEKAQSGDINLDGTVNRDDAKALLEGFGKTSDVVRQNGDLDLDGKVTLNDLLIWKRNFGQSLSDAPIANAVAVPEGSTFCMLIIALVCFCSRSALRSKCSKQK